MECAECGSGGAKPMRVEYVQGPTERLQLCGDCRAEFEAGNFVEEVTPVRHTGDGS